MLQICPKLTDQQFEELPFEEEIITFLRDLGHSGEIKVINDVNVNKLHQPWRSFAAVINKCRSVENKNVKRSNEMYHPRFTKVIINFFMTKDSSIPRRNRLYGVILPDELTNEAIKDSESYKEYYAIALGAEPPKTKGSVKKKQTGSNKTKNPLTAKGKRLKTLAKVAKPAKKKQPAKTSKAKGLTMLSEVALTEVEQMELATKKSLIQTHSSHASGSGTDEGTSDIPWVPDVSTYAYDDEKISWKSSDEEDHDEVAMSDDNDDDEDTDDDDDNDDNQDDKGQDDDNEKTDSDNDGDEIDYPKFSTHDQEERQDEEDNEEEGSDLRVQTPSHYESTDDEESDEVTHGANVEGEELDEEETNEEDAANELYRDVNVNLEGRDTEMTDAPRTIVQTTQVIEDTHVIITLVNPKGQQLSSSVSSGFISNMLNPSPDTCIDSIFNLNTESTSLVDVPVTTIVETPLSSTTTLPLPPIPLITHL
ncbi:retrovirus-related pol polyprotein from transposon TNT 1-94 [Tanacetum coccineum]